MCWNTDATTRGAGTEGQGDMAAPGEVGGDNKTQVGHNRAGQRNPDFNRRGDVMRTKTKPCADPPFYWQVEHI